MRHLLRGVVLLGFSGLVIGSCGDDSDNTTAAATQGSGTATAGTSMSSTSAGTTAGSGTSAGTTTTMGTGPGTGGSTAAGTTTSGPDDPVACGNNIWECGDGMDNDGDGLFDLDDPECSGPCDDDEGSFQTGIPGDNVDCRQDCFFDGNSGQGDDGCLWDLRCDPANPGEFIGCEFTGGNNCNNQPPNQSPDCIMFCQQFVPPGCDCFGCCTVEGPNGPVDIFLNSDPPGCAPDTPENCCSLAHLENCQSCTSQIDDCGNTCDPQECEVCFGESEPPPGCEENMCDTSQQMCKANADCAQGFFCQLGCCFPQPPG